MIPGLIDANPTRHPPKTMGKLRPPVRPNLVEPARPSESGRTRIWDGRPSPAELRLGTAVRTRPNSDLGRPSESGRTQIGDGRPNPAEKQIKHDRNQSYGPMLHVLDSKLGF